MRTTILACALIGVGLVTAGEPAQPVGFDWLAGTWRMQDGTVSCDEYWSAPRAGSQFGAFRLTKGDKTVFLEIFVLRREEGAVTLRLRHFTPELKSWKGEERQATTWTLVRAEGRKAVFSNATSQISYERTKENRLIVRLQPRRSDATLGEGQTFGYTRME